MEIVTRILLFLLSAAAIWFSAGMLIKSVDQISHRFHTSGFTTAFFLLGFLTSLSEISVAANATLDGVPHVSAGNLIGASLVILLFIVPFLAVIGNGITLRHTLSKRKLRFALVTILLPAIFIADGNVTRREGLAAIIAYVALVFVMNMRTEKGNVADIARTSRLSSTDVWKIIIGAGVIFIAGGFLVEEAVYFSNLLRVPTSLIGLILLSIGTNVPELTIAIRSIMSARKDIAFGDYIGSAVTNTPIFGMLALAAGGFHLEAREFAATTILLVIGVILFYIFTLSNQRISRKEGIVLLGFYGAFVLIQIMNLIRFSAY